MKILLFYPSHRQLDEIKYSSTFFNKTSFLKNNSEVYVHCNNIHIDEAALRANVDEFKCVKYLTLTDKNSGYLAGPSEAIADSYEMFVENNYDYVIHLHPDVYIINETKIVSALRQNYNNDADFLVYELPKTVPWEPKVVRERQYAFDFFIFKPKIENNVFKNYAHYWTQHPKAAPERFLYDMIHGNNKSYAILERGPFGSMLEGYRRGSDPEPFGIWHCHDNEKVKRYIEKGSLSSHITIGADGVIK
jgi:hypothetical protein